MSTAPIQRPAVPRRPGPWASALDRDTAMVLAGEEYARLADLLAELSADEWRRPTECPAWDVRQMAGHCVGMAQMVTRVPEAARQLARAALAARRSGRAQIDELTDLQVREHADLPDPEVAAVMRTTGAAAVRGRRGFPKAIRAATFSDDSVGSREKWRVGYLVDTILTRDPWTHRGDICRATGRELVLTADHDGRIVDDVVTEWGLRHGRPFALTLTGPAGGHWQVGTGGEHLELDAVDFCRILSGRADGRGLLATRVPF
ncbi:hypothetical protein GCM10009623_21400 [Nocardioides aestuarii]|uniref:Maleylpyruvate isomerase family mycothiol-dependent enzyme n=1 Tax=Nocardioides aestuarii TaxID=252231 RepID=A0ABW4TNE4_9ACTN